MNGFSPKQKLISGILKAVTFLSALIGIVLSAEAGRNAFMGGSRIFMYFTIQSNIAAALICAVGFFLLMRGKPVSNAWFIVKFVVTVSITLTGAVFCLMLAPLLGDAAWSLPNTLTHAVVPAAAVLDFFVTGVSGSIRKRSIVWVTVPPLLYVIYAGIGYVRGWQFADGYCYPYFFLNWGSPAGAFGFSDSLPYLGCVWWILILLAGLAAVGLLYLGIVNLLKKGGKSNV